MFFLCFSNGLRYVQWLYFENLDDSICVCRTHCEQSKVSSYEVERNTALIQEKMKRIAVAEEDKDVVEKDIFQKEIQSSRLVNSIHPCKLMFYNRKCLDCRFKWLAYCCST